MKQQYHRRILSFFGSYSFFLLLLVLLACRLVYVIPTFPIVFRWSGGGIDPSWAYGLSVATSEHFVYGKDIIFTFGPLSAVQTGFWSPYGHTLTVTLSFILAISLCFYTFRLFVKSHYFVKCLLILFLFIDIKSPASFFRNIIAPTEFFFTLLPALAALDLIRAYGKSKCCMAGGGGITLFSFIGAALLLVKLSYGVEFLIDALLLFVFYAIRRETKFCLVLIASFVISFTFLYTASGQSISNLCYYPLNVYYGIAGYNDAMSNWASGSDAATVAISAFFLLLFLVCFTLKSQRPFNLQGIFSVFILSLLLLVVFKHSYVRNDTGHRPDIYLLMCFLLIYILAFLDKTVYKYILITACILSLLNIGSKNEWYFFNGAEIKDSFTNLFQKAKNIDRLINEQQNMADFAKAAGAVRKANPLPVLDGTSDIYSYDQAFLLVSGNRWNPRPAFQSYQAVTPYLAKINYDHLLNDRSAPDNIFFSVQPMDRRMPSLDDGLSWKALIGLYRPAGWTKKKSYLILRRTGSSHSLSSTDARNLTARFGQEIINPFSNGLVFLKLL